MELSLWQPSLLTSDPRWRWRTCVRPSRSSRRRSGQMIGRQPNVNSVRRPSQYRGERYVRGKDFSDWEEIKRVVGSLSIAKDLGPLKILTGGPTELHKIGESIMNFLLEPSEICLEPFWYHMLRTLDRWPKCVPGVHPGENLHQVFSEKLDFLPLSYWLVVM